MSNLLLLLYEADAFGLPVKSKPLPPILESGTGRFLGQNATKDITEYLSMIFLLQNKKGVQKAGSNKEGRTINCSSCSAFLRIGKPIPDYHDSCCLLITIIFALHLLLLIARKNGEGFDAKGDRIRDWWVKEYNSLHTNCTGLAVPTAKNVGSLSSSGEKPSVIVGSMQKDLNLKVTQRVARNAVNARKMTTDSFESGFSHLRSYCRIFSDINPGSKIDLCTNIEGENEYFQSLFFMSGSQANCAKYCRPVCSLDGAHFKTVLWDKFVFLVAATQDGNNRDVIVGIHICKVENTANMEALLDGLMTDEGVRNWLSAIGFVLPVDRARCIKAAIYSKLKDALVRDCAKHAQRNFLIGKQDMAAYWGYITATTQIEQDRCLGLLRISNPIGAQKLEAVPKELLCNLNFPGFSWGEWTNNISERAVHTITPAVRAAAPTAFLKGVTTIIMISNARKKKEDEAYEKENPNEILCKYAKGKFSVSSQRFFFVWIAI